MRYRNSIAVVTAVSAIICSSFALAQRSRLEDLTGRYRLSRQDAAAMIVIGDTLHYSDRSMLDASHDTGRGIFDLAPSFLIADASNRSVYRVWRERDGRSWRDYALDLGMDLRGFNALDLDETNFDRMMWANLLQREYGCGVSLWDRLRDRGISVHDTVISVVLGNGDPYLCDEIYSQYRTYHYDWVPVFTWFVAFEIDFGRHHRYYRDDYRRRDRERIIIRDDRRVYNDRGRNDRIVRDDSRRSDRSSRDQSVWSRDSRTTDHGSRSDRDHASSRGESRRESSSSSHRGGDGSSHRESSGHHESSGSGRDQRDRGR